MTDMLRLVFTVLVFVTLNLCSRETPVTDGVEIESQQEETSVTL